MNLPSSFTKKQLRKIRKLRHQIELFFETKDNKYERYVKIGIDNPDINNDYFNVWRWEWDELKNNNLFLKNQIDFNNFLH